MRVGLFIPCYVNAVFPEVGVATCKLLDYLGADTGYPLDQTCCGQPMGNAGFENGAAGLAGHFDALFESYDYVVSPSVGCTSFVKENYPRIREREGHTCGTSGKIYEVCEFLHDILKVEKLPGRFPHKVSIHNSCHGVRKLHLSSASELNIQPFSKIKGLLSLIGGIECVEPEKTDECCGFGGMFSIEEPAVSVCMGQDKLYSHIATGADYITGADASCFMHMQGIAKREKRAIRFIHVVQILASGL
ncbi:MAG: (Fe-S)-binding protein [Tannerellaceae bacterium]|jgi:L-lactate dehydrogenase complex protein LldE|nr:(Fe-S)-binding protein [Tannerellaceae bacterium]